MNAKGIYNKANYPNQGAIGSAITFSPSMPVYFTNANGDIDYTRTSGYFNWLTADGSANNMAGINPLSQLYDPNNRNSSWRSMGNAQLDYKIHGFEDLRLNLNLGYDFSRTTGYTYNTLGSILALRNANEDYYNDYANQNNPNNKAYKANKKNQKAQKNRRFDIGVLEGESYGWCGD